MKQSLVVSDIDGTLLDRDGKLDELTYRTISELVGNGIFFSTASARSLTNLAEALGPAYEKCCASACANGSYVVTADNLVLDDNPVDKSIIPDLLDICDSIGASYCCISVSEALAVVRHKPCEEVFRNFHNGYKSVDRIEDLTFKTYLINVYAEDITSVRKYIEAKSHFLSASPESRSPRTGYRFMMIQNGKANKGTALQKIAAHFKTPIQATLGIGDGAWNDGPLLRAAGYAVAMRNARSPIFDMADQITDFDNDNCGAAHFLRRHFGLSE